MTLPLLSDRKIGTYEGCSELLRVHPRLSYLHIETIYRENLADFLTIFIWEIQILDTRGEFTICNLKFSLKIEN